MSSVGSVVDYKYTYERERWVFHIDDQKIKSKNIGIIFIRRWDEQLKASHLPPYQCDDMLLKHGNWDSIYKEFKEHERYGALKGFADLRLSWVPPTQIEILNDAIQHGSSWCSVIEDNVNKLVGDCLIILDENNSGDDYLLNPPSSAPWVMKSPLRSKDSPIDNWDAEKMHKYRIHKREERRLKKIKGVNYEWEEYSFLK